MSSKVVYNHKVTTSSTHKTINYLWEPLDLWNIVNFCTVCHQLWLATLKSTAHPTKGESLGGNFVCSAISASVSRVAYIPSLACVCPPKRIAHPQRLHCERGDFQKHPYWPLFDSQSWPDCDGSDQREPPKIRWLTMIWKRPLSKKEVIFMPERGLQFMEMFQFALLFWIHVISNGSQSIVINTAFAQTMARAVWLEVLCLLLLQLAASSCATSLLFVAKSTRRHNDLPNWYLIADVIVELSLPWWMEIASVRQVLSFCCQNLW